MTRPLPLFPTSLVGSMPQPEWLIDRAKLAGRFPPRVRARELWRVPEPLLAEAQDDATIVAIKAQEDAGLDIVTDGEIRRESYSNLFATALDGVDLDNPGTALDRSGHPNPVPRVTGAIRRRHPVGVRDLEFLRRHTTRHVKVTVPGPFTMSQQAQIDHYGGSRELAAMDYAAAVNAEIRDLFSAGADIVQIDEPYMQARPEEARGYGLASLNRALEGVHGTTAVHICFGYAAIIHARPSAYSFLPELAGCGCRQVSLETAQPELDCSILEVARRQADHPRRHRPRLTRGRERRDGRHACPAGAAVRPRRGHHPRAGLRDEIPAARSRSRKVEIDGCRCRYPARGDGAAHRTRQGAIELMMPETQMNTSQGNFLSMLAAWLLAAAVAMPAVAQNQEMDEVVVTARKRDESFQDVPVTINVFTEATIRSAGIEKPGDFIALVPNMTLVETQNAGNAFVVVRGISQARNSEPSRRRAGGRRAGDQPGRVQPGTLRHPADRGAERPAGRALRPQRDRRRDHHPHQGSVGRIRGATQGRLRQRQLAARPGRDQRADGRFRHPRVPRVRQLLRDGRLYPEQLPRRQGGPGRGPLRPAAFPVEAE